MDSPPSYPGSSSRTCSLPSPTYSETPSPTEYILQSPTGSSSVRSSSAQDFIYKLKNAEINLGARAWGTNTPIYGGNGLVEGRITLREDICNVSSITLKVCFQFPGPAYKPTYSQVYSLKAEFQSPSSNAVSSPAAQTRISYPPRSHSYQLRLDGPPIRLSF